MENRIKTWVILVAVGTVLGFAALIVAKSARINEVWGWVTGISIFLNFFLAGMVGNARNAAQRANEVMAAMYDRMQRNINPEPIYVEQPRQQQGTTFEIQEYPAEEHRPRPVHEAEQIGRDAEEAERRKREDQYRKERKTAGYTQGYQSNSTTLSVDNYYQDPITGQYRQKRR